MPYIKNKMIRNIFNKIIYMHRALFKQTGNLNYFLFKLAQETCLNYADYRNFIGELEASKLEIYRRQIAPYEDKKVEENGDVE